MNPEQRLHRLLDEASRAGDAAAVELLEEAIRLADELGRIDLQYELRRHFVHRAYAAGNGDRMLVALSWCLGMHQRRPGEFDDYAILTECQLALQYVSSFLNVSRQQIEQLMEDTQRRYDKCGASPRSLLLNRCFNAFWMGDLDAARRHLTAMQEAPRDDLYHPEWEIILEADYYRHLGDDEALLALPILRTNTPYGVAQKYVTSYALAPLLRRGDAKRADYLLRTAPLIRDARTIDAGADQLVYLFAAGRLDVAAEILEEVGREALRLPAEKDRLQFLAAAAYGLDRLRREGMTTAPVRLPAEFPGREQGDELESLVPAARAEAQRLAAAFDDRNGTSHVSQLLQRVDELRRHELPRR